MKTTKRRTALVATLSLIIGLSACSGMTHREKDTAVGAAVGGVLGNVVTGGSAIGTVGGAAAGGIIGNQVGKQK